MNYSELHGFQDYIGAGVVLPNYDAEHISKLSALIVLTSVWLDSCLSLMIGNIKTYNYSNNFQTTCANKKSGRTIWNKNYLQSHQSE